jgi:hypothetical protein
MAVYAVFEPPARSGGTAARPEQFTFVRDGFSWTAFVFGPLWMLRHRMWLVLVLYLVVVGWLVFAAYVASLTNGIEVAVALLLGLLIGLEAATLRRLTLLRRRWNDLGIVVGDNVEAAERRFFDRWVADAPSRTPPATPGQPTPRYDADSYVIGMFSGPGAKR